MDWEKVNVIQMDNNKHQRWIREVIKLWKLAQKMGIRDKGTYVLSHTWDAVRKEQPESVTTAEKTSGDTSEEDCKMTVETCQGKFQHIVSDCNRRL